MLEQATPTVLALGAWLKNAACLLDGEDVVFSTVHGDLRDAKACQALEVSARALVAQARAPIAAIAHDLHPDFYSTQLAHTWAHELQVPAIAVQHHHAHIAVVMAEHHLCEPVIGLALDGVGLGTDGMAWGGELLHVAPQGWRRLGHLWPLQLPGGDSAARQPWRMLVSALHTMGREKESEARLASSIPPASVRMILSMLHKNLNCPWTTSAGRWFDAAAAALGLQLQRQDEAEAAIALEQEATRYLRGASDTERRQLMRDTPTCVASGVLDMRILLARLLDWPGLPATRAQAAAWFHMALARALADWAAQAARHAQCTAVCLGGGCFMNAILAEQTTLHLQSQGLRVFKPVRHGCGDAGLALGQAWVATQTLRTAATRDQDLNDCNPRETLLCA